MGMKYWNVRTNVWRYGNQRTEMWEPKYWNVGMGMWEPEYWKCGTSIEMGMREPQYENVVLESGYGNIRTTVWDGGSNKV